MRAARLLETPVIQLGHMCEAELEAEWVAMHQRSRLTQQLIDGLINWEFYFDWMVQHGFEPEELIDTAQENLDFAINEGIPIEL